MIALVLVVVRCVRFSPPTLHCTALNCEVEKVDGPITSATDVALTTLTETEGRAASKPGTHFAAFSCNKRTYNRWSQSADMSGPRGMAYSSSLQIQQRGNNRREPETDDAHRRMAANVTGVQQGIRSRRLSMLPPHLDWGASELSKPVMSSVSIFNLSPDETVMIHNILTDETQFFNGHERFEPVAVHPHGNVSLSFLFIPQSVGLIRSHVSVSTSSGNFSYRFQAVGTANAHGVKPLDVLLAPGQLLRKPIPIHNPGEDAIRVLEVYTPEDAFLLQLPDADRNDGSISERTKQVFQTNRPDIVFLHRILHGAVAESVGLTCRLNCGI